MPVLLTAQLGQLFFFVGGKGQRLHSEPKPREGKQQEKGSGGGSERLFVIMVQIQTADECEARHTSPGDIPDGPRHPSQSPARWQCQLAGHRLQTLACY